MPFIGVIKFLILAQFQEDYIPHSGILVLEFIVFLYLHKHQYLQVIFLLLLNTRMHTHIEKEERKQKEGKKTKAEKERKKERKKESELEDVRSEMSWYLSLPPTRQDLTQDQWPEGRLKWGLGEEEVGFEPRLEPWNIRVEMS